MIRLEKVSKYYASGDNNVSLGLHNVSLEMKKGEIIGIVGESGSGKSTFLNVCSLIDTYEDGEIYYDGIPASSFSPEEIDEFRKNHIGFIFQNYNLIDSYTVLQNILMPLLIKGVDQKEAKEKAKEIIKKVGLENRMHHKGTRLSGGEKQRCVIARALASDSEILACDEPTGNLDSTTGREIIELIKEVASDKLVLIVTHNYDELKDIITRRLTFADGNLIEDVNLKEAEDCVDKLKENSEYKFSFKERLRLSIKDIFSTPRKSFLTFMIFLAISLFIAYLYTSLITYKDSYADEGEFNNVATDRYVIYEDGKKFDMDDFSGYDYNEFAQFEDELVVMKTESLERAASYVRFSMPNVKLKKGVYPTNDYEVVLGIPENALSTCFNETATFDLRFGSYDTYNSNDERIICAKYDEFYEYNGAGSYEPVKYKIVGYYVIKDSTVKHFLVSGTKAFNEKVVNTFIKRNMVVYEADCYYGNNKGVVGELSIDDTVSDDTIKMIASKKYEGKIDNILDNIKFYYTETSHLNSTEEIDLTGINIEVTYIEESYYDSRYLFQFAANINTLFKLGKRMPQKISIYESRQLQVDNLIKDMQNKGYGICNAKEAYVVEDISFSSILNTILYAFFIVGILFSFTVIFFISYFILARIYSIKNKDYTVFRTLGMSKKDMASLVRIQTVILSLSTAILVVVVVGISYIFNHPIISGFHRVGVIGIIVYLLFMFVYSLFFAIRFNRKLYKFSVSKTFRGGVLGND